MHRTVVPFLFCASFVLAGCGGDGGGSESGGGGPSGEGGSGPGGGGCPLTLKDGGTTYEAISCVAQGYKTFASGVYQIEIGAPFNMPPTPVRSISFTVNDDDDEMHVKAFSVGKDAPGFNATYKVSLDDQWGTLEDLVEVGSGSFEVTEYDRTNKLISATYDVEVKQGSESKQISGKLTHVPMAMAE